MGSLCGAHTFSTCTDWFPLFRATGLVVFAHRQSQPQSPPAPSGVESTIEVVSLAGSIRLYLLVGQRRFWPALGVSALLSFTKRCRAHRSSAPQRASTERHAR